MACDISSSAITCVTRITAPVETLVLTITTTKPVVTSTRQIITTCQATTGETITLNTPLPPWSLTPSSTQVQTPTSTSTITTQALSTITNVVSASETSTSLTRITVAPSVMVTEILVVIEDKNGNAYTTLSLILPIATSTYISQVSSTPLTLVVGQEQQHGWDAWSDAAKGGLIAGCVLAFLVLLSVVLCWCMKRRQTWVAHEWNVHSHPGYVPGHPTYGSNVHNTGSPWMRGGSGKPGDGKPWVKRWYGGWRSGEERTEREDHGEDS